MAMYIVTPVTPSENSSKSKTTTGKTILKLVKIQILLKFEILQENVCWWASVTHQHTFPYKFRVSKNSYFINNQPIFLKLRIFTNSNTVFPLVVLVFYFEEFSEEVLHGH
jgi:hypothetical protein